LLCYIRLGTNLGFSDHFGLMPFAISVFVYANINLQGSVSIPVRFSSLHHVC
jgi:hypothetical protein